MTIRFSRAAMAAAGAVTALSAPAHAAPTLYTNQASFAAATAGTSFTTQGFETPFAASNTLSFPGLTISCSNCAAGRSSAYPTTGSFSLGINGGSPLTFAFDNPVTAFGFSIRDFGTLSPTNLSLVINGTNVPLLNTFSGTSGNTLFFGVTDTQPFTSAILSGGVSGDNYYLDDVRFGASATGQPSGAVPEPATWAMMMLGFGGMGYAMRRKTKVAARIRFA